jgi:hypothetical protein
MAERAKNPAKLTEQEKDAVDQVLLGWGAIYAHITTKYSTPKKFAEVFISLANSKKGIATVYSLLNAKDRQADDIITSSGLNKELARVMFDNSEQKDPTDITTSVEGASEFDAYINSTDMTKILKTLEYAGIYLNIKGKNEVRRQRRKGRLGRPKVSDKTPLKFGGRPSVYKITEKIEKLKAVIQKPEVCDRIRKSLIDSGLLYPFEKFMVQALYYAAKKDKSVAKQLFRIFVPADFIKDPELKSFQKKFWSLDESQLEQIAAECARISIQRHSYYDVFLFVVALNIIVCKLLTKL